MTFGPEDTDAEIVDVKIDPSALTSIKHSGSGDGKVVGR